MRSIFVCCRCGKRRTCTSVKMALHFQVSTKEMWVNLCKECVTTIKVGDALPRGCLSWQNLITPHVAALLNVAVPACHHASIQCSAHRGQYYCIKCQRYCPLCGPPAQRSDVTIEVKEVPHED